MKIPGYKYIEVGSLVNDPKLDVVQGFIIHVTGTMVSPRNFFDGPSNGIESHGYTPRSADDSEHEQYRDTLREADANFRANSWVTDGKRHGYISWEFQGLGSGTYTRHQLDEIKRIARILSLEHDFPLKVPTGPRSKGVGYHTQFDAWSNVPGKICPGPNRIDQYHNVIVPWMKEEMAKRQVKIYVVQRNESAPKVAEKFGLTVLELWRLNPGTALPLREGMKVRVQ